jgi:hypothetical protein
VEVVVVHPWHWVVVVVVVMIVVVFEIEVEGCVVVQSGPPQQPFTRTVALARSTLSTDKSNEPLSLCPTHFVALSQAQPLQTELLSSRMAI